MTDRPALSVVIPSVNGPDDLYGCLDALEAERTRVALDVLVADRLGDAVRDGVRRRYPWVRVLPAPEAATIPELRALAISHARADRVAVIEDHVLVPPGWASAMVSAIDAGHDVVGGTLYNAATHRTVDWAAFLCEYSHMLAPREPGPTDWLTGNNTVYRRAVLDSHSAVVAAGRWEDHLHEALRRDGVALVHRPDIVVAHKKHYSVTEYLTQRFLYSRSHAGARVAGRPVVVRAAMGLAAVALPPVLLWRIVARVRRAGRYRGELVRSLPLLVLFVGSWAAGDMVGFLAGPGGSLSRVR